MLKSFNFRTKLYNYMCALLTFCLLIFQFTPFWNINGKSLSISRYIWIDCSNDEFTNWFSSQLGTNFNVSSIVAPAVLTLIFGAVGVFLCIFKSKNSIMTILPAVSALSGLYAFIFKPAFRLGSTWIIQLIICIAILALTAVAIKLSLSKSTKKIVSTRDISDRVAAIRALGDIDEKGGKKSQSSNNDSNFNKLLTFLNDESPECRIAAAETLAKTSRDVACTNINHVLLSEKDERVIKAMREALVSIHQNMRAEHTQNA